MPSKKVLDLVVDGSRIRVHAVKKSTYQCERQWSCAQSDDYGVGGKKSVGVILRIIADCEGDDPVGHLGK